MKSAFYYYVRILKIDGYESNASGELLAYSYQEAVDYIYRYYNTLYGKILSIYISELPKMGEAYGYCG